VNAYLHNVSNTLALNRGVTRPNMTQQVGRAQHGPTYNGPIYLYRLSILSACVILTCFPVTYIATYPKYSYVAVLYLADYFPGTH